MALPILPEHIPPSGIRTQPWVILEPAHLPGCLQLMFNKNKPPNTMGRCPHLGTVGKWDSLSSPGGEKTVK